MRIMKKALKKPENRETEGINFMHQYKYLGLILQNTGDSQLISTLSRSN
jgi:hypothetical protein